MVEKAQAFKEQGGIATIVPAVFRRCLISKVMTRLGREARAEGVPYGNVKDPIGQLACHGYALFQGARVQNKRTAFFQTSYLLHLL